MLEETLKKLEEKLQNEKNKRNETSSSQNNPEDPKETKNKLNEVPKISTFFLKLFPAFPLETPLFFSIFRNLARDQIEEEMKDMMLVLDIVTLVLGYQEIEAMKAFKTKEYYRVVRKISHLEVSWIEKVAFWSGTRTRGTFGI